MSSVSATVGPGDRVEELLLDRGVHRELLDDPVDDLALLDVGPVAGLLESLEQLLDGRWSFLRRVIASMGADYPVLPSPSGM